VADERRSAKWPALGPAAFGIGFASLPGVLHLSAGAPATPHLPRRRFGGLTRLAASAALHAMLAAGVALVSSTVVRGVESGRAAPAADEPITHLVFLAPEGLRPGGGGGGGGNRQPGPVRRAQGVGTDPITLRVRKRPPPVPAPAARPSAIEDEASLPAVVLEAKPMASGLFNQIGLPAGGVLSSSSTGRGSGGGVGTGRGTGVGSGDGPGLGPGSGGGAGGGVYRPGGQVSSPRLIREVRPRYTSEALRSGLQGTVWLEVVVIRDGRTSQMRVVKSLDHGGLDQEAMAAVAGWRFEPGRLAGEPVDVLVTILVGFSIR
jgi:protein TonB